MLQEQLFLCACLAEQLALQFRSVITVTFQYYRQLFDPQAVSLNMGLKKYNNRLCSCSGVPRKYKLIVY